MFRTTRSLARLPTKSALKFSSCGNFNTIFAKSSGQGKCGISIIRVSGPQTKEAIVCLTKNKLIPEKKYERKATLQKLFDPENGEVLDSALVIWFKEPRSFTGEDCCEFHVHGGLAVVSVVLVALTKIPGLRHAKPGEFTRRAFYNGKLNLTEIEGLADLIHAETEVQRKQAIREMDGALTHLFFSWRKRLIKCTANVEAWIDFSEEENIEKNAIDLGSSMQMEFSFEYIYEDIFKRYEILLNFIHHLQPQLGPSTAEQRLLFEAFKVLVTFLIVLCDLEHILNDINEHIQDKRRGEILRNGIQAVIVGRPNVGKSSLLNYIYIQLPSGISFYVFFIPFVGQRPISIVSPIAGTTRDVIDSAFDIGGYAVLFSDTAGLRINTKDSIELEGVNRARKKLEEADLALVTLDVADFINDSQNKIPPFEDSFCSQLKFMDLPHWINDKLSLSEVVPSPNVMLIFNKCDMLKDVESFTKNLPAHSSLISCKTGEGVIELIEKLQNNLEILGGNPLLETGNLLRERHIQHLKLCRDLILEFMDCFEIDMVIAARKLRMALNELGKITGEVRPDDILDVIFKDFCIGK
ncbi:tRNA modification GTPase GTPBP3, mitochondrial [Nymphon striatum]|nr:tRNA modification GTPase GTPBP3, mitochondrial [Nymphon striatum]